MIRLAALVAWALATSAASRLADQLSWRWLVRDDSPYLAEIKALAVRSRRAEGRSVENHDVDIRLHGRPALALNLNHSAKARSSIVELGSSKTHKIDGRELK